MKLKLKLAISLLVLLTLAVSGLLLALPTSEFELDGNAVVNGTGDDWQNTVPISATSEALVSTFVADGSGNKTIFTGGGSKDISDINQWAWKDQLGGLPDKDNLTNAYAAAYTNAQNELTVYFGADRFATAGDAELGFWFFHSQVQTVNGKFVGGDGVTTATHTLGDILVLANFSNGGSNVMIQVFKWVGGNNPLLLVDSAVNAKCGVNTDPNVCAITNEQPVTAPWSYTPKSGSAGTFPEVSFFEGGINLSAFINIQAAGCFSSFLAETRSSTSQSATLKDFALGSFNTCDIDITKTCPDVSYDAGSNLLTYTSHITVTNKGFGAVYDVTVNDTPTPPGAFATFSLASLGKNESHVFDHTFTITPGPTAPNPPNNTATVTAAVTPGGLQIVDGGSAVANCPQVTFDAALTVTKSCRAELEVVNSKVVVAVLIEGQVCNVPPPVGKVPESINNVSVTDTPAMLGQPLDLGTLTAGQCKPYSSKYYPSALTPINGTPNPLAGNQTYLDTVAVTGTGAITANSKMNTVSASCPLCPPHLP